MLVVCFRDEHASFVCKPQRGGVCEEARTQFSGLGPLPKKCWGP